MKKEEGLETNENRKHTERPPKDWDLLQTPVRLTRYNFKLVKSGSRRMEAEGK